MVTPAAVVLWTTAILALLVAWIVARQDTFPGHGVFSWLMIAIAAWALCSGAEAAAVPFAARILMSKLEYIGFAATPVLFLMFAAELSSRDRWLTRRRRFWLWVPAIATIVLAATNEWHGWLWADFITVPIGTNRLIYVHGPAYYVIAAEVYLLLLASCALVIPSAVRPSGFRRRQARTVLLASVPPVTAGILYVADVTLVPGLDLIPVSFAATGVIFLVGIGLFRVFDLASAARTALVEQISDAVLVADTDSRIVDANPIAAEWLADSGGKLVGRSIHTVLAPWPPLLEACRGAQGVQMELTLQDDPMRHVDVQITPLRKPRGHTAGCFVVLRDITQRHRSGLEILRINDQLTAQIREIESLHEELREQAIRDGLTGLFNRRYLDEVLPRELERAAYDQGNVSIVMIDIDHFKRVNDQRGHREGDRLLALLGEVLRHGTRPNDAACRYGGEEFLLVLPGVAPETALKRMESLRKRYATRLQAEGFDTPPTLSAGIAAFPLHAQSDDALLGAADAALYQAKATGRNRVYIAEVMNPD